MDLYFGCIWLFGGNFAPRGSAFCSGQLIGLNTNTALFSLLGTTYGGNGQTTFALPDLRGRTPIGAGQGPGRSNYVLGQAAGLERVTLVTTEIPVHTHSSKQQATTVAADASTPENNYLALSPKIGSGPNATTLKTYATPAAVAAGPTGNIKALVNVPANTGGGQSHENMQPYLAINYCIALEGIFPSRN